MFRRLIQVLLLGLLPLGAVISLWGWLALGGRLGDVQDGGTVLDVSLERESIDRRSRARQDAAGQIGAVVDRQILFGDLHAHTTFSSDAFLWSLPLLQGDGAHPPADACHFARFCSGLDFWSINDHAESLTPERWQETVQSIRACNEAAGDPAHPDLVAFLGWEWTQVGATPDIHYGHKNVILLRDDPELVPARPIAAGGENLRTIRDTEIGAAALAPVLFDFANRQAYYDFIRFQRDTGAAPLCPPGAAEDEPCIEVAETPSELFAALDRLDAETLVIPHGTSWGATTPPGVSWSGELALGIDPSQQPLIEVYSGHGNSEEYRDWRATEPDGSCPPARADYLPICRQAGEIIRRRCEAEGLDGAECEQRAEQARNDAVKAGRNGALTIPGQRGSDWSDAEQCRDCFLPPFAHRPGKSAQAALATRTEEGEGFRFGLIASSDNHSARPGSGYKEFGRLGMTDERGLAPGALRDALEGAGEKPARSVEIPPEAGGIGVANSERQASFWTTGGLVAVHAAGRDRDAIWNALGRREVYGTSGPRILLWFDLVNGPMNRALPMGSEAELGNSPRFRVRTVGSAEPLPGCPEASVAALGEEQVRRLCMGECEHPSDIRRAITRIEVVRIRPQASPDEPLRSRIEDPWRVLRCSGDPAGCVVEFEDEEFGTSSAEWIYYVRAIEAPSQAVDGAGLACTDADSDCLGSIEERAWSSPLFLRPSPSRGEAR